MSDEDNNPYAFEEEDSTVNNISQMRTRAKMANGKKKVLNYIYSTFFEFFVSQVIRQYSISYEHYFTIKKSVNTLL